MKHIKKAFGIISLLLTALMVFLSCAPAGAPLSGTSDIGISLNNTATGEKPSQAEPIAPGEGWQVTAETSFKVSLMNKSGEGTGIARVAAITSSEGEHSIYIDILDEDGKVLHSLMQRGRGFVFALGEEPSAIAVLTTNVLKDKRLASQIMYYSFGDSVVNRIASDGRMGVSDEKAEPAGIAVRRIKNGSRQGGGWVSLGNANVADKAGVAFSQNNYAHYTSQLQELLYNESKNGSTYFYTLLDSYTEKDTVKVYTPHDKVIALEPGKDHISDPMEKHLFDDEIDGIYEKYLNGWF
ncbi:MAG: hypothetical protein E7665_04530 [Ruminococcaceae bacterium]|nr:hypothetical protein [Oscillospiraceae bacterium]